VVLVSPSSWRVSLNMLAIWAERFEQSRKSLFVLVAMVCQWKVVGGSDCGGILVRTGRNLKSDIAPQRLATGAIIQEEELIDKRLRFTLLRGDGPLSGWVSIRLKEQDLLVRMTDEAEQKQRNITPTNKTSSTVQQTESDQKTSEDHQFVPEAHNMNSSSEMRSKPFVEPASTSDQKTEVETSQSAPEKTIESTPREIVIEPFVEPPSTPVQNIEVETSMLTPEKMIKSTPREIVLEPSVEPSSTPDQKIEVETSTSTPETMIESTPREMVIEPFVEPPSTPVQKIEVETSTSTPKKMIESTPREMVLEPFVEPPPSTPVQKIEVETSTSTPERMIESTPREIVLDVQESEHKTKATVVCDGQQEGPHVEKVSACRPQQRPDTEVFPGEKINAVQGATRCMCMAGLRKLVTRS